jgi:hypothetical protein
MLWDFFMNFELLPILKAHHYTYTVQIWALPGLK